MSIHNLRLTGNSQQTINANELYTKALRDDAGSKHASHLLLEMDIPNPSWRHSTGRLV